MPLSVGVTPFAPWNCLEALMKHLGWHNPQPVLTGAELDTDNSTNPWLLLYTRPEHAIAHALDQGQSPEQALSNWQTEAKQLLNFFRAHRGQAALVDLHAVAQYPGEFMEWLTQHHNAFSELSSAYSGSLEQPPSPTELNLLLATQLVGQTTGLRPLMAHLEASSIPFREYRYGPPIVDIDRVRDQLVRLKQVSQSDGQAQKEEVERLNNELKQAKDAKSRAEANEKDLKEENDLILKQLFKVQEELEKYYLMSKDLEKRLQDRSAEFKKRDKELKERDMQLKKLQKDSKSEVDKLRSKSSELQSKSEELHSNYRKLNSEKTGLEKQVLKLQAEISGLKKDKRLLTASIRQLAEETGGFKVKRLAAPIKSLSRASRRLRQDVQLVRASDLFDETWYLSQNPDVKAQSVDPALHFTKYGGIEGRAPSPGFDSASYLEKNPDVAQQGFNPLVHYLLHGKAEGRNI